MLKNLIGLVTGVVVLVVGFMFSVVLLAIFLVLAVAAGGFFWWKTRKLRRAMREQAPRGQVIDGEAVVVEETATRTVTLLSADDERK